MEALKRMPFTAQKEIFKRLAEYADTHHLNQREYEAYQNSLWIAHDNAAVMEGARIEGRKEGEKIGREKGEKIGREKGEKIGREKGERIGIEKGIKKERIKNAKSLLAMGLSPDQVAKAIELPIEEVLSLQREA